MLGVFSLFRGDCQGSEPRNYFTHVASFESLVLEALEAAGHPQPLVSDLPELGAAGSSGQFEPPAPKYLDGGGCVYSRGAPTRGQLLLAVALVFGLVRRRRCPVTRAVRSTPSGQLSQC